MWHRLTFTIFPGGSFGIPSAMTSILRFILASSPAFGRRYYSGSIAIKHYKEGARSKT